MLKPHSEIRKMWANAPFAVTFKVYVFNITNPVDVMAGGKVCIKIEKKSFYFLNTTKIYRFERMKCFNLSRRFHLLISLTQLPLYPNLRNNFRFFSTEYKASRTTNWTIYFRVSFHVEHFHGFQLFFSPCWL